jgi:hypothetical protein
MVTSTLLQCGSVIILALSKSRYVMFNKPLTQCSWLWTLAAQPQPWLLAGATTMAVVVVVVVDRRPRLRAAARAL